MPVHAQGPGTGGKLFTRLNPEHTKIDFNNVLNDHREYSILLYSNYYGGAGVGIGDINNDGLQDIYFAGNLVADRLYLNLGSLVFEDITKKAGIIDNGGWSSGVVMGDINNDGFLDIYVTRELYDDRPDLRKNLLYINNGNNTFTESAAKYGVDDDNRTRHAAFLDYDKDGDLDLFLCNQPPNPGAYSPYFDNELLLEEYSSRLYENLGQSFVDVTQKAGLLRAGFPNSVMASDLNGDGWTDIWLSNDYWVGDFLYINNGDGTFSDKINEQVRHITFSSMGIDEGDINNDGLPEVFILDMVPEKHVRLQSNMGGLSPEAFRDAVNEGGHHQYFTNTFFLNAGGGFYSDISKLAGVTSTDWSWSVLFADLDNDGWKDIFIANGLMRDIRDYDAAIEFPKYVETAIHNFLAKTPNPENISVWDIVDMENALKISPSVKTPDYAFKNNRDLTFTDMSGAWGVNDSIFSHGAAYADLDNDGDLDIVVNNVNDIASVYRNNTDNNDNARYLRVIPVADRGKGTNLGTKIRIETDEGLQIYEITSVRGMYSTSEHIAHFGLGNLKRVDLLRVTWPDGRENILKNVKSNQVVRVLYSDSKKASTSKPESITPIFSEVTDAIGIKSRHHENIFDDYRIQKLIPYKMSEIGAPVAAGDINGDGIDDLFIGASAGDTAQIYISGQGGKFELNECESLVADKLYEDMSAAFFDSDGDGDLDLYVVSGGNEFRPRSPNYQDRLYINDGSGNFTKNADALPRMNISGSRALPNDFDKDGDQDLLVTGRHIAWSYPDPESSTILLNNSGKFEDVTKDVAPELVGIGMVNDAQWVDFNGDGLVDIVLAGEWMPVTLFLNTGGQFKNVTKEYGLSDRIGWWFSIAAADMDRDGDQDLIAGNFGLNSEYQGTAAEPLEIFYTDIDINGLKDIIFAVNESGKKYPLARKKDAAAQVPFINDKFSTFASYAKADIFEIYGKENLDRALHYSANTFASMYLENTGNGRFIMHELPKLAQISSVNDILIEDFTGDNNPDILIAGNLYSLETNFPRNDAGYGLLLEGDGHGNYKPIEHSGFFVPYDVKSMAELEIDNVKYILVGCNNDSLRVFKLNK